MKVPFLDLKRFPPSLKRELYDAVDSVLSSGQYILGERVRSFEDAFASYCKARFAVAVASGTDALHLALRACGIGPGDEVITVANTCVPTVTGITMAGAVPVFVDIHPSTLNIDPALIEAAITSRTRAILPVHLYGRAADMHSILRIAERHGLRVIEDCAQAHGASIGGKHAGTFGDAGCFSFYPTKNLGALGDGGIVISQDHRIAENVRLLRTYGESDRYLHQMKGFNSRLDELQAAVLLAKLPYLDEWNSRRREIARAYRDALAGESIVCPLVEEEEGHVFHLFVVRVRNRNLFRERLRTLGIGTLAHYPRAIPEQPAYSEFSHTMSQLHETARACREVVSLPLFPEMTAQEISFVIEACKTAAG